MDRRLDTLLEQVRERGDYPSMQEAARATHAVLDTLGAHLVGDDRTDLARLLPAQCAPSLTDATPASEPLTPQKFLDAVAACDGVAPMTARRHTDAVLRTITAVAEESLIRRILTQLPPGHAALFGQSEPV